MKTIHLIRHAKSSWGHPDLDDIDRPLNKRGQRACRAMAQPILEAGCRFEHVFCSVARRTQSTIEGIAESLPDMEITWQLEDALYTFDWQALVSWVHRRDESLDEIVTIGHNPATTDFCNTMGDQRISNIPTCGYAQLRFDVAEWTDILPATGKVMKFLTPAMIGME